MTPTNPQQGDRYDMTLHLLADTVTTLRELEIPADRVHSLSVEFWSADPVVQIHIDGATDETVAWVDKIAVHYRLPEADPDGVNYGRGRYLGLSPVHVYCGRPEPEES